MTPPADTSRSVMPFFSLWLKSYDITIQMKALEQRISMVLFVCSRYFTKLNWFGSLLKFCVSLGAWLDLGADGVKRSSKHLKGVKITSGVVRQHVKWVYCKLLQVYTDLRGILKRWITEQPRDPCIDPTGKMIFRIKTENILGYCDLFEERRPWSRKKKGGGGVPGWNSSWRQSLCWCWTL